MKSRGIFMYTEEFTFPSSDGKTTIHAVKWRPDEGEVRAVLQIAHGMIEYINRYTPLAEFLTTRGIAVVGHDHLGHGQSVTSEAEWGYFGMPNPSNLLVEDMHTLRTMIQKEYPDVPYFMAGHSMGSYLLRKYLGFHSDNLCGVILLGTGYEPEKKIAFGMKTCTLLAKIHNWHYRSKFVTAASFGKDYRKYDLTGKNTANSWLSKDEDIVKNYYEDPACRFMFTLNGYMGLYEAIAYSCNQENVNRYPKDIPVFLMSGADDPVGNFGVGVKKVYDMLMTAQMEDITYRIYENDRHEILNETDKDAVYSDLLAWINVRIAMINA